MAVFWMKAKASASVMLVAVHEQALGPVDHLAGLELLLEATSAWSCRAFISWKRPRATSMAGTSSLRWNGLTR